MYTGNSVAGLTPGLQPFAAYLPYSLSALLSCLLTVNEGKKVLCMLLIVFSVCLF